ncbi:FAD-dependent oxidoreductase [Streptomyces sp. M19]
MESWLSTRSPTPGKGERGGRGTAPARHRRRRLHRGLAVAYGLRRRGFDGPITVFGDEPQAAYERPALSKRFLTAVGTGPDDIRLRAEAEAEDVRLELGVRAAAFDVPTRALRLSAAKGGRERVHTAGGLVIATGSAARRLPMDTRRGARAAHPGGRHRVPNGVGGPAPGGDRRRGLHRQRGRLVLPRARPRRDADRVGRGAAGAGAGQAGRRRAGGPPPRPRHAAAPGAGVAGFTGRERVTGVRLADGAVVPADVVLVGVGARPATDWLRGSGLPLYDGVLCGPDLAVTDRVVAAGDVARWPHHRDGHRIRVEHWENALRQADAAAATLLAPCTAPAFTATTMVWSELYGLGLQLVGQPRPGDRATVVEGDLAGRRCVVVYSRAGRTTAALLCDSPHRLRAYRDAVAAARPVSAEPVAGERVSEERAVGERGAVPGGPRRRAHVLRRLFPRPRPSRSAPGRRRAFTDRGVSEDHVRYHAPFHQGPLLKTRFLSHGTLECRDVAATRRFYEEVLGLEVVQQAPMALLVRLGGDHCYAVVETRADHEMPLLNHNGLDLGSEEEVREAHAALGRVQEEYGIKKLTRPTHQHGVYSFYVQDLDGNWWEICHLPQRGYAYRFENAEVDLTGRESLSRARSGPASSGRRSTCRRIRRPSSTSGQARPGIAWPSRRRKRRRSVRGGSRRSPTGPRAAGCSARGGRRTSGAAGRWSRSHRRSRRRSGARSRRSSHPC